MRGFLTVRYFLSAASYISTVYAWYYMDRLLHH